MRGKIRCVYLIWHVGCVHYLYAYCVWIENAHSSRNFKTCGNMRMAQFGQLSIVMYLLVKMRILERRKR